MDKGNLSNYLGGDGKSLDVEGRYNIVSSMVSISGHLLTRGLELRQVCSGLAYCELVSVIGGRLLTLFGSTLPLGSTRRSYRRMLPSFLSSPTR